MLKKAKAEATGKPAGEGKDLSQSVLDSSRQIWLAGLGAFSRAQAEGTKVFETLVRQGETLESKTRKAASDTAAMARGAATAKVREVQKGVGGTWDKLEQVFEDRVERALSKLGVYTQNDVVRLSQRVDALSDAVNELIKATGVSPKRVSPKRVSPKRVSPKRVSPKRVSPKRPAAAKKRAARKATGKARTAKK